MLVHGHAVRSADVDEETRCAHNGTERDVVAIRFHCCDTYYPCHRCHVTSSTKTPSGGPWGTRGARGAELAIQAYIGVSACPDRGIRFNQAVRTTTTGTSRRRPMPPRTPDRPPRGCGN